MQPRKSAQSRGTGAGIVSDGSPSSTAPGTDGAADRSRPGPAPHRQHHEEDQFRLVDGVAPVKHHPRRDRESEGCQDAGPSAQERAEGEDQRDASSRNQRHRQAEHPYVPPEQRLRDKKKIEMERSVEVAGIVVVETLLRHFVHEPAVDSFIEVGRLHPEANEPENQREQDDGPGNPGGFPTHRL